MSVIDIWEADGELAARWSLSFKDLALLNAKPVTTRLGFAAQLMMYRTTGRFGWAASEFLGAAIAYLAEQIGATAADFADALQPGRFGQHTLQHERVHVDQAVLQQMERQHGELLILETVARHLAALAEENEAMGAVPVLDHVEPGVDLAA